MCMRFLDGADLAAHVADHLGSATVDVERGCEIVLAAFGASMPAADRELFVQELPSSLHPKLKQASDSVALPIEQQLVTSGLKLGQAREMIASVCHVLAEVLSDDTLARLHESLPDAVAAFLVRPAPESTVMTSRGAHAYATLAEGRPGSDTPVSEARADRTQPDSVVAENPHADTKLSSSTGSTQERDHETIAEGQPAARGIAASRG